MTSHHCACWRPRCWPAAPQTRRSPRPCWRRTRPRRRSRPSPRLPERLRAGHLRRSARPRAVQGADERLGCGDRAGQATVGMRRPPSRRSRWATSRCVARSAEGQRRGGHHHEHRAGDEHGPVTTTTTTSPTTTSTTTTAPVSTTTTTVARTVALATAAANFQAEQKAAPARWATNSGAGSGTSTVGPEFRRRQRHHVDVDQFVQHEHEQHQHVDLEQPQQRRRQQRRREQPEQHGRIVRRAIDRQWPRSRPCAPCAGRLAGDLPRRHVWRRWTRARPADRPSARTGSYGAAAAGPLDLPSPTRKDPDTPPCPPPRAAPTVVWGSARCWHPEAGGHILGRRQPCRTAPAPTRRTPSGSTRAPCPASATENLDLAWRAHRRLRQRADVHQDQRPSWSGGRRQRERRGARQRRESAWAAPFGDVSDTLR